MLKATNIKKFFKKREILKGVYIEINKGEVVGLLGPNGAGKTTLFNCLVGFLPVDEGQIILDGEDITHMPAHKRAQKGITFLPQEHTLFEDLSVLENLLMFLEFFEETKEAQIQKAQSLLTDFGLWEVRNLKAYQISGGQKRRLEIARALITNPKYLFLDEPFTGIDPILISEIKEMIIGLKNQSMGILITDHNVRETIRIVDRVYILSEGKILAHGSAHEVANREDVKKAYLGKNFVL